MPSVPRNEFTLMNAMARNDHAQNSFFARRYRAGVEIRPRCL